MKNTTTWARAKVLSPAITQYMPTWRSELPLAVVVDLQVSEPVNPETGRRSVEGNSTIEAVRKVLQAAVRDGPLASTQRTESDYLGSEAHQSTFPHIFKIENADGSKETVAVGARPPSKAENYTLISASDFVTWLIDQRQEPSVHIAAWLAAVEPGSQALQKPVPEQTTREKQMQRQDLRLKQCRDDGLTMDKTALRRLPDGVGKVAEKAGVKRQSFSADVKDALKREEVALRQGETVHRL